MSQNRQKLILNWIVKRLIFSKLRKRICGSECRWFEPHIPPKIVTRKNKRGANFRSSFHLQSFLWSIVGEGAFSYDASKKGFIANPPCIGGYKEKGSDPNCNEPQKLNKKLLGFLLCCKSVVYKNEKTGQFISFVPFLSRLWQFTKEKPP